MLLTYLKYSNYTTWRSLNYTTSPHMLENFICYRSFFCQVKDCKLVNISMCRYHTSILATFKIIASELKVMEKIVAQNYWKIIGYQKTTDDLFNHSLSMSKAGSTTYSNYNKHILESSANNATINNQKIKGWFQFSCDSLLPLIKERDALISNYQTLGIGNGDLS